MPPPAARAIVDVVIAPAENVRDPFHECLASCRIVHGFDEENPQLVASSVNALLVSKGAPGLLERAVMVSGIFGALRRQPVAFVALFFALGGSAVAETKYLTASDQITKGDLAGSTYAIL